MKLAIVGTNFISDSLVAASRIIPSVEIEAIYSRKLDTGRAFAEKHDIKKVYTDYTEMLCDDHLDAVYIASPNICHHSQSIAAMRAGKHVLCEKVMATTPAEADEMISVSRKTGRVLLEAMRPAHDPLYDTVRDYISRIGTLRRAHFEYCQYSSRYDRFKAGIMTNAFNPTMRNSALADIGIYPLHMAIALFGIPCDVSAHSEFLHNGFEGSGNILLHYENMTAEIVYSKISDGISPSVIEGDLGTVTIDKISAPSRIELNLRSGTNIVTESHVPNNMIFELDAFERMTRVSLDPTPYLALTAQAIGIVDRVHTLVGTHGYMDL